MFCFHFLAAQQCMMCMKETREVQHNVWWNAPSSWDTRALLGTLRYSGLGLIPGPRALGRVGRPTASNKTSKCHVCHLRIVALLSSKTTVVSTSSRPNRVRALPCHELEGHRVRALCGPEISSGDNGIALGHPHLQGIRP